MTLAEKIVNQLKEYKKAGHIPTGDLTMHFHERAPYMCVVVSYHGLRGRAVGLGFSRTEGPWDPEHEYAVALESAAKHVQDQLGA